MCGKARANDNYDQLRAMRGPFAEHYLRQMRAAFGLLVLDGTDERP